MRLSTFCVFALFLAVMGGGCSGQLDQFPTTPDPVRVTETYTGTLTINGAATHSFFTGATGSVVATLTSLGENPPAAVGFSMGTFSGATCSITTGLFNDRAVVTSVITGTVSTLSGSLCVRIHDVGSLTESVPYEIKVEHP
jgi:ABC-type nitrate/sulfonate/bicarbonate transport system permease component